MVIGWVSWPSGRAGRRQTVITVSVIVLWTLISANHSRSCWCSSIETDSHRASKGPVEEQAGKVDEGGACALRQGQQPHVGGARSPICLPKPLEQLAELIVGKGGVDATGKRVEADSHEPVKRVDKQWLWSELATSPRSTPRPTSPPNVPTTRRSSRTCSSRLSGTTSKAACACHRR